MHLLGKVISQILEGSEQLRLPNSRVANGIALPKRHLALLAIVAATIVTRIWRIGDPAIQMDEQFYLLVGDRIWQGAIPYVDIWDRKPVGLFLIYAALRPLSPDGIVGYQLGAFASVIATALVIRRIGQRFASDTGATVAAVCYIFFLPLIGGSGGQAPIFYNLAMALAGLFVIRASDRRDEQGFTRFSHAAMLLCGLALQIKYTVVFEAIFFGLWLLVMRWHRGTNLKNFIIFSASLVALGLAPTLLVCLYYVAIGHFDEYFYANFLSILAVSPPPHKLTRLFLAGTIFFLSPILIFAIWSIVSEIYKKIDDRIYLFLPLWTAFAILGYFSLGNNYHHYALPVLLPLVTLCSPLFQGLKAYAGAVTAIIWFSVLTGPIVTRIKPVQEKRIDAMVSAIRGYTEKGCAYINDGPVILYLLTNSCLPTPYIFPEHLNNAGENQATHAPAAMAQLLRKRPSVIMVADRFLEHPRNRLTAAMLDRAVARDYHEVARLKDIYPGRKQIIYARNDLR